MSIFSKVFNKLAAATRYEMVTDKGNGFYMWNGTLFQSDIVRSCIRPKAKAVGKLVAKHIRKDQAGIKVNPEPYLRFLLEEPNPYMTGQVLQEKLATQLMLNGNAFAVIMRNEFDYPVEIYPIPAVTVEAIYNNQSELFLKFYFRNGKQSTFSYNDIIHLRQDFNENDIFGESPAAALTSLMEIVNTTDQGIVKAVKNSGIIKWLLKYVTPMRPEDLKKEAQKFTENYLSLESGSMGVAAVDSKAEIQRVEPKDYVPNALVIDRTTQRILSFYNTNEDVIQSKYDEDGWNSYFEAEIEPLAIQLSNEFTRKIFTRRERGFGNKIVFETSNLQFASLSTKLALVAMVDRGALSPNEWRATLGLAPVEGGDEIVRRLDTEVVDNVKGGESE
ncbi:phage portal protein [Anaerotignum sp.]|uniref:phage portal protein n=1 Tax=Anaerotignum sp. TaxID=2039241 RepID=UPI0028A2B675|nr:phage portal protein [Anaerotignum sp.]